VTADERRGKKRITAEGVYPGAPGQSNMNLQLTRKQEKPRTRTRTRTRTMAVA
jgi:hypothetical protein